ncbi:MAG: methyltransferase domain-containing protein [Nocardioides sp.]
MELLASQLGHPRGPVGRLVGRLLNRANRGAVAAAVAALSPAPGETLADVGFGGGLGLDLLLRGVGPDGHVLGIEISQTMIGRAERRFRRDLASDRLRLHSGSMTGLPLATGSIDGALTINTIYFVDDLDLAFAELGRVIRPAGRVVIGLGDPDAMARMPFTQHGFRVRPATEVIEHLGRAGLTVQDHRRVGGGEDAVHLLVATPNA